MPLVEGSLVSLPSPTLVKMEERKRAAIDNDDSAPPLKRQATSVNGAVKPHIDADMPWQDDLEVSIHTLPRLTPWAMRPGPRYPVLLLTMVADGRFPM